MDIKSKKTGLATYLSVLNMDKTECQLSLKITKEKISKVNTDILETKMLINSLDEKIREISNSTNDFVVDSYDLIRKNISLLIENEQELIKIEKQLSSEYDAQLKELHNKQKHIDVCSEKYTEYDAILKFERDKIVFSELDDLCIQRKWITEKDG